LSTSGWLPPHEIRNSRIWISPAPGKSLGAGAFPDRQTYSALLEV